MQFTNESKLMHFWGGNPLTHPHFSQKSTPPLKKFCEHPCVLIYSIMYLSVKPVIIRLWKCYISHFSWLMIILTPFLIGPISDRTSLLSNQQLVFMAFKLHHLLLFIFVHVYFKLHFNWSSNDNFTNHVCNWPIRITHAQKLTMSLHWPTLRNEDGTLNQQPQKLSNAVPLYEFVNCDDTDLNTFN